MSTSFALRRVLDRLRRYARAGVDALPTGDTLDQHTWRLRHAWTTRLLWAHAGLLPAFAMWRGVNLGHALTETSLLVALALASHASRLSHTARSVLVTLGLVTASAQLVHYSDGLIEAHFHFFIVLFVVSLYQSWRPFIVALAAVLFHHGVVGSLAPAAVYNHPAAIDNPWRWALIHSGAVAAASAVALVTWRLHEDLLRRERAVAAELEAARDDLAAAQQLANVGSWEWDLHTGALSWSAQLYRMFGVGHDFAPSLASFLDLVHADDRARVSSQIDLAVDSGLDLEFECRITRPGGVHRTIHVLGHVTSPASGGPTRMLGTCQDITERRSLEREVERRAFYDAVTDLPNRALFDDRLRKAFAVRERAATPISLLYIDLDGFKAVNDTFGHAAGDLFLMRIADRIRTVVRDVDSVARLGGDEFAILLERSDTAIATTTAVRILEHLREPVVLDDGTATVTASIGIADTGQADSPDELLLMADLAMYAAKHAGKNLFEVFDPDRIDLVHTVGGRNPLPASRAG